MRRIEIRADQVVVAADDDKCRVCGGSLIWQDEHTVEDCLRRIMELIKALDERGSSTRSVF